jgi:hypothetical protein
MPSLLACLLCAASVANTSPTPALGSFLFDPSYQLDEVLRGEPRPYLPQPGDIMLYTENDPFWTVTHALACAFKPHGSGIVLRRLDGSLGILEAGPNDTLHVRILDLLPHLHEYEVQGPVWIRRRREALTPAQSDCLTTFALRQDGKRFALVRLGGQLTPFRSRGPLRTYLLGGPHGERDSYFCSELVTESLVAAGLIDGHTARPAATYPRDLFSDRSYNLYLRRHFSLACGWEPPARWVSACPGSGGCQRGLAAQ